MMSWATIRGAALAAALLIAFVGTARVVRGAPTAPGAQRDEPKRLVIAIYKSEAAATEAMSALKAASDQGELGLESRALVVKQANGKVKVKDRRAKGTRSGQAVAAVASVLGAPAGLGVGATTASATDYLTGDAVAIPKDAVEALKVALQPGDAAVVSAVDEKDAAAAANLLEGSAERVVSHAVPSQVMQPEGRPRAAPMPAPRFIQTTPSTPAP